MKIRLKTLQELLENNTWEVDDSKFEFEGEGTWLWFHMIKDLGKVKEARILYGYLAATDRYIWSPFYYEVLEDEKTITIDGKEYSKSTVKKALQEYVK